MSEVRQTSLDAYREINEEDTVGVQEEQVLTAVRNNPDGLTRFEISQFTGMLYSSVCGRVNSLIKKEKLFDKEKRKNASGKSAYVVKAYE